MANPLDDLEKLLNAMRDRGAEMAAFENTLMSVNMALADIVSIMETGKRAGAEVEDEEDEMKPVVDAIDRLGFQIARSEKSDEGQKSWRIDIERSGTGANAPMKSMTVTRV